MDKYEELRRILIGFITMGGVITILRIFVISLETLNISVDYENFFLAFVVVGISIFILWEIGYLITMIWDDDPDG